MYDICIPVKTQPVFVWITCEYTFVSIYVVMHLFIYLFISFI